MVVAAVAIVLAIVLWLAPEGEPFAIIRFVFQCVGLAAMITGCVLFFVAAARGMVFPITPSRMRTLTRRDRQLVGRAAIGRAVAPSGTEDLVRITARRIVVLTPRQVAMSVGAVLLEASVVSQTTERWAATRWITTGGLVLFVVALGSTLWMNRAALRVLGRDTALAPDREG